MTAPALVATSLYRFFHSGDEETQALRGVSLTLEPGEFVVTAGPSGSGKSTLLSCLGGLDEPDGGTVTVGGERITRRPEAEQARLRARLIGFLAQNSNLFAHLTVRENLQFVRKLAGRSSPQAGTDLLEVLGIARRAHARTDTLSGGELARAGLAVALANEPVVLLADEPTGELDTVTEQDVLRLLRRQADSGTALLVASHSPAVAAMADRVISMVDGVAA